MTTTMRRTRQRRERVPVRRLGCPSCRWEISGPESCLSAAEAAEELAMHRRRDHGGLAHISWRAP